MSDRGNCTANHMDHVHVTVDGPDPRPGGFTYEYRTVDDGARPCPPRVECGSDSVGGTWLLPTKSDDWRTERANPGNDPGDRRGAANDHGRCHAGWDIAAPSGQRIVAPAAGRARTAVEAAGAGNYVTIDHGGGVQSLFMHMSRFADGVDGRQVQAGQVIGYVGSTGHSSGPHLHFEVRVDGVAKDPRHWVLAGAPLVDAC
jgi:murein DD-endopeptidase MepM/ murein hydrolase activator NlpD